MTSRWRLSSIAGFYAATSEGPAMTNDSLSHRMHGSVVPVIVDIRLDSYPIARSDCSGHKQARKQFQAIATSKCSTVKVRANCVPDAS